MRVSMTFLACLILCAISTASLAEKRVALVIGNGDYRNQPALGNPQRDARLVSGALQKLGFQLVGGGPLIDLDKSKTDRALATFGSMAQGADVAVFYYAGHGMQVDGANYLIPIDLASLVPGAAGAQALDATLVLSTLDSANARLKLVLLDACRTNPFSSGRGTSGVGLAPMQVRTAKGTVIGFATQPNTVAVDGPRDGNSPYAKALADRLGVGGLELFTMLNEIGLAVMASTDNRQQPWINASPIEGGRVVLNNGAVFPLVGNLPEPVNPTATLDLIRRAYVQLDTKDYRSARNTLTRSIDIDGNFAPAFSYRGFSWYLEGQDLQSRNPARAVDAYRNAQPDFNMAIRLDPNYAPVRRHSGNNRLAMYDALRTLGKPTSGLLDGAINDLQAATMLDPTSKSNAFGLGQAYLLSGSYQAAIDNFRKAIARDGTYAAPYAGLCKAYRMMGKMNLAQQNARLAADRAAEFRSMRCLTDPV
jgi:tetratricopeptide (TPR) repeat protein